MVSTMKGGPIPPHPYYDKSGVDPKLFIDVPNPRVRPEAKQIYNQAHGSVGLLMQIEGHRVPTAFSRNKGPPKDHISANVRRMRKIQRQSRQKEVVKEEVTQAKPVKALWKSNKYEGVASRVLEDLAKTPSAPRPQSGNYLRAHSRTGFVPMSARPASTEPEEDPEPSVPRAQSARDVKFIRRELDFIKLNGKGVKKTAMRKSPSMTALDDMKNWQEEDQKRYKKGEVPKYLQTRQQQWHDERQQALNSIPDPDMPEGHRLMEESERRETLDKLKQTEKDLQCKLASLPIRTDTVRIRRQKQEIEQKIGEVEEAMKIFSRRKVFVKLD